MPSRSTLRQSQRVNEPIKTKYCFTLPSRLMGWLESMFESTCVMCRRASFALPSNRGWVDEHASTTSAPSHQHSTASISPRPLAHHVSSVPTLVYHPITVATLTTTNPPLRRQVKCSVSPPPFAQHSFLRRPPVPGSSPILLLLTILSLFPLYLHHSALSNAAPFASTHARLVQRHPW